MASVLSHKHVLSKMPQLFNGLKNVIEGEVHPLLLKPRGVGVPSSRKLFDRRDINHPVVQEIKEFRHFFAEELSVVPHAVATQGCFFSVHPLLKEREGGLFGLSGADAFLSDAVDQSALVVVPCVPVVHARNEFFRDCYGEVWTGGQHVQFAVGDNGSDLNDGLLFKVEPGHFQVDPNHALSSLVHVDRWASEGFDSSSTCLRSRLVFCGLKGEHDLAVWSESHHRRVAFMRCVFQRRDDVVNRIFGKTQSKPFAGVQQT